MKWGEVYGSVEWMRPETQKHMIWRDPEMASYVVGGVAVFEHTLWELTSSTTCLRIFHPVQ